MTRLKLAISSAALAAAFCSSAATAQSFPSATQVSPDALRAVRGGPERIVAEQGFVLKTNPAPDGVQEIVFRNLSPGARWVIDIPFEVLAEGASTALVRCVVYGADADRTVIGGAERSVWLNGVARGTIQMGIGAAPGAENWPAGSFTCRASVSGVRAGREWVARDVTQPGATDTDVWVREDAESEWWGGAPFERPFRLLIAGNAPRPAAKAEVSNDSVAAPKELGAKASSAPDGSEVAWRPPPVPPLLGEFASDWRPPPIPPK